MPKTRSYTSWSGTLKTDMNIGFNALVEVEATVEDSEITDFVVMYRGVDIYDALNDASVAEMNSYFETHWRRLINEAEREEASCIA